MSNDVVFKAKACIDNGELRCASSEKTCSECEYKDLFKCKEATIILKTPNKE